MKSLTSYLGQVQDAWNDYDGEALAKLLSFRDPHVMVSKSCFRTYNDTQ